MDEESMCASRNEGLRAEPSLAQGKKPAAEAQAASVDRQVRAGPRAGPPEILRVQPAKPGREQWLLLLANQDPSGL